MKQILLAGAALAALSTASFAADMPIYPAEPAYVEPAPANDWSGFYVGIQGGYAWGDVSFDSVYDPNGADFESSGDYDLEGFLGGIYAGSNMQWGSWVLGVDSSISFGNIDGDDEEEDLLGPVDEISREVNWLSTTRGRVGFAFDNFMIFAAGGLALAETEGTVDAFGDIDDDEHVHAGWTVGGGVEAKFSDNWSARVEYLYVDLGDDDYYYNVDDGITANTELDMHIVRGGLAYHF